ncbi:hypothetical protein CsatB_023527 [Cannabis sativa]|uniref:uncharacterized protein LOC133036955 n=1 Tax=Cannabis sativa TaxID=3483 RepID=UPI0029CA81EE|nr:uncharacterized protein LOC133036955 [Cannabis sativa]
MVAAGGEDSCEFDGGGPPWRNSLQGHPHCYCGDLAYVWTSSSRANPGRRFFGCPHYENDESRACDYFCWIDKSHVKRSTDATPGLRNQIKILEEDKKRNENVIRKLIFIIFICLFIIVQLILR